MYSNSICHPKRGSVNTKRLNNMEVLKDIWAFLKTRKKWWLLPIVVILLLLGFVIVIGGGSVIAPFIYSVF